MPAYGVHDFREIVCKMCKDVQSVQKSVMNFKAISKCQKYELTNTAYSSSLEQSNNRIPINYYHC